MDVHELKKDWQDREFTNATGYAVATKDGTASGSPTTSSTESPAVTILKAKQQLDLDTAAAVAAFKSATNTTDGLFGKPRFGGAIVSPIWAKGLTEQGIVTSKYYRSSNPQWKNNFDIFDIAMQGANDRYNAVVASLNPPTPPSPTYNDVQPAPPSGNGNTGGGQPAPSENITPTKSGMSTSNKVILYGGIAVVIGVVYFVFRKKS